MAPDGVLRTWASIGIVSFGYVLGFGLIDGIAHACRVLEVDWWSAGS